jgi:hypothetical protein
MNRVRSSIRDSLSKPGTRQKLPSCLLLGRTIKRWVRAYRQLGVAGLVSQHADQPTMTDSRWIETALGVMVEHTEESRPFRTMVIDRTNARVVARFGEGVVKEPSRATALGCWRSWSGDIRRSG